MSTAMLCMALLAGATAETDVAELIRQLDADRFSQRQLATQRLADMGPSVFDALVEAARGESREVRTRAIEILERQFQAGDETVQGAAKAALEKLAADDTPAGQLASAILNPPQNPVSHLAQAQLQRQMIIAQLQAGRLQQGMRIAPAPAARPRNVIRRRTITFRSNNKKVRIEINNGQIKIETTETKDGKETTKKVEAKNEAELKKKHPEAYKLFQRHAGGVAVRAELNKPRADPFGGGAPPRNAGDNPFRGAKAVPLPKTPRERILDGLKRSEESIEKQEKQLRQLIKGAELDKALDRLQRRRESLKRIRDRFEEKAEKDNPFDPA